MSELSGQWSPTKLCLNSHDTTPNMIIHYQSPFILPKPSLTSKLTPLQPPSTTSRWEMERDYSSSSWWPGPARGVYYSYCHFCFCTAAINFQYFSCIAGHMMFCERKLSCINIHIYIYTLWGIQKHTKILLCITSWNINRFSKFFHCLTQEEICYKPVITYPTTP